MNNSNFNSMNNSNFNSMNNFGSNFNTNIDPGMTAGFNNMNLGNPDFSHRTPTWDFLGSK